MKFDIITIFPKIFDSYLKESLVKRALEKKIIDVRIHNLRDFSSRLPSASPRANGGQVGRHKKARPERQGYRGGRVDDKPFGGGPGMVLQVEPISKAIASIAKKGRDKRRVILFSTRGKKLDAKTAKRLSKYDELILICGRYEGVDERVAEHIADEEVSIGDYVLSGGELPALVLMEAVSRFIPGFLGKHESLEEIKGSYPVYTRPEVFKLKNKKLKVPEVLLSGDHKKIGEWRKKR